MIKLLIRQIYNDNVKIYIKLLLIIKFTTKFVLQELSV